MDLTPTRESKQHKEPNLIVYLSQSPKDSSIFSLSTLIHKQDPDIVWRLRFNANILGGVWKWVHDMWWYSWRYRRYHEFYEYFIVKWMKFAELDSSSHAIRSREKKQIETDLWQRNKSQAIFVAQKKHFSLFFFQTNSAIHSTIFHAHSVSFIACTE